MAGGVALAVLGAWLIVQVLGGHMLERLAVLPS